MSVEGTLVRSSSPKSEFKQRIVNTHPMRSQVLPWATGPFECYAQLVDDGRNAQ